MVVVITAVWSAVAAQSVVIYDVGEVEPGEPGEGKGAGYGLV